MENKAKYIENLEVGTLVAYRVSADKIKSGKVTIVASNAVEVEDYEGLVYIVKKEDIIWVKTGKRWPKPIFTALKEGGSIE